MQASPVNGVLKCPSCDVDWKFPLVKYKIHIKMKDETEESTFVLFDGVADKLLDTCAHKLFNSDKGVHPRRVVGNTV